MARTYGLCDKPMAPGFWANDGYEVVHENATERTVVRRQRFIKSPWTTTGCQYDQRMTDPKCIDGCPRK